MFVLLAVAPQIIGHSSYNWALKYLPATFAGVGTLGEPHRLAHPGLPCLE